MVQIEKKPTIHVDSGKRIKKIIKFTRNYQKKAFKILFLFEIEWRMPFIYNDSEWKLIDDDEPYDKKCFVVAHKLYVSLSNDGESVRSSSDIFKNEEF